jgi:hypothetical protein
MDEIWFEEELIPFDFDPLYKGDKDKYAELIQKHNLKGSVRLHIPRHRSLHVNELGNLKFERTGHSYILVKLGCEFDPGELARKRYIGFVTATLTIYTWGEGKLNPLIFDLFPVNFDSGKGETVKLSFAPAITFVSGAGVSLGGIETDIGEISPTIRGFKGKDEREPYWNLKHHRECPLYGIRNFWILVEMPPSLPKFSLVPVVEASLQTQLGPLKLGPKIKEIERRDRYVVYR